MMRLSDNFRRATGGPVYFRDVATLRDIIGMGDVEAAMTSGRWWKLRLNGHTRTWKRSPDRFRIPVKAGLRSYGAITEADLVPPQYTAPAT